MGFWQVDYEFIIIALDLNCHTTRLIFWTDRAACNVSGLLNKMPTHLYFHGLRILVSCYRCSCNL
jgi:hypothetical protein